MCILQKGTIVIKLPNEIWHYWVPQGTVLKKMVVLSILPWKNVESWCRMPLLLIDETTVFYGTAWVLSTDKTVSLPYATEQSKLCSTKHSITWLVCIPLVEVWWLTCSKKPHGFSCWSVAHCEAICLRSPKLVSELIVDTWKEAQSSA